MDSGELSSRLARVYAALNAVLELDLSKFQPSITIDNTHISVYHDFRGGLSDAELENIAHSFIHNLANLKDHTRKWLSKNEVNPKQLDSFRTANLSVRIVEDLSNNDKHGYPPRDGGVSSKSPRVISIHRVMQLSTGSESGSFVGITFTPSGQLRQSGSDTAAVVVTGDVVDSIGNKIGDLHEIQTDAISAWEGFYRQLGVLA